MKIVLFNTGRVGAQIKDNSVIDLNYSYAAWLHSKKETRPYEKADLYLPSKILLFIEEGQKR
jgi:hypothetical protein